jgi:mRNA-degrading endonuclease RelE of RelBE toxin-antitoxin system
MAIDVLAAALKQFDALPKPIQFRVERLVDRLDRWPNVSGVKALSGDLAGHYRVRTGDYRVQFRVERLAEQGDWLVVVEKIGHRDGFYGE